MADFNENLGWLIKEFEYDVRKGVEARETMIKYIARGPGGIAHALEWATGHCVADAASQVAAGVIERLENALGIEDVTTIADALLKEARAELDYMSLSNNQLNLTGKTAYAQAVNKAEIRVRAFVDHMNSKEAQ